MDIVSKMNGSELSATEFNQIPDECENVIKSAGLTPSDKVNTQMADAIAQIVGDGSGFIASGTANAIILTQKTGRKAISSLTDGLKGTFKSTNSNTSATTLNLCNLGAKPVVKNGVALEGGEIKANMYYNFIYDATNERFEISSYIFETDETIASFINRLYDGVDLTQKFADEIADYSDEWQWIKARIDAGNFDGLLVGDYIPVTIQAGMAGGKTIAQQTLQCQIAGINTYKNCGDTEIGNHIDFISREVIDTEITWNPKDNNNGTSAQHKPWLASQVYAWLNGINNYTTSAYQNVAHGMNALNSGIFQLLPTKLRNLIIQKRMLLDNRYSSSELLTYSQDWDWVDAGFLWLPDEMEVYGTQVRSNLGYHQGYWNPEAHIGVAYPLYLGQGRNRVKRMSNGTRSTWWLMSVPSNNSTNACNVNNNGNANNNLATNAGIRVPLCFRIG